MADIYDRAKRSQIMSAIKGRGNLSTEERLRKLLVKNGISGWRRHLHSLPGKPDFTFPKQRVCIFVHGCFWHGCPHCYKPPKTNKRFWREKIAYNKKKDRRDARQLRERGYSVLTVWECKLRNEDAIARRIKRFVSL
ncbi:DNA mismatch endonuclease Vsr [Ruficoccus amylovorans]|uniref:Very short patch repair endonuclease n=1 Tax=Ruficoccus amylovorans TaxID=1804625 RepID=A0A842HCF3_9BACT|nr:DNA mismatch endonuclease Vsr [Ruficoccus amylovorans]